MASRSYNTGIKKLVDGTITYTSATIKAALVKSAYTHNPDDDSMSDITGGTNEITVSGYSRQTLGTKTLTQDDTNDRVVYDAADPVFSSLVAGQTVGGAVIFYDPGTGDANTVLLAFLDVTDTATNGGTITINFSADGVLYHAI